MHGGGRLHEAIAYYQSSLQIFDDNALTDYCIAQVQMQLSRFQEADARFQKILAGQGIGFGHHNLWVLHVDYGWLLARVGHYEDAVARLGVGVREKPDLAYAWNALGVAHARRGDFQDAVNAFLQAVELQPLNSIPWSNAALVANVGGGHDQAHGAIMNALALAPGRPGTEHNARIILQGADDPPSLELWLDNQ